MKYRREIWRKDGETVDEMMEKGWRKYGEQDRETTDKRWRKDMENRGRKYGTTSR